MVTRREVLLGAGACCTLPGLWYAVRPPRRSIDVRFWITDRADRYDGVADRIASHLETALDPVFDATVSAGGAVPVRTEHGYWVTRSGEWPRRIIEGAAGTGGVHPVADVNLLVTDGEMRRTPTGAALPNIASVGGARHLADVAPRSESDDVIPNATPARVMHTLLHEVGHALGLEHEHGSIVTTDERIVVSPMIGAYAWADDPRSVEQFGAERNACGTRYPSDRGGDRYLSFSFSDCEAKGLREYDGGLFP